MDYLQSIEITGPSARFGTGEYNEFRYEPLPCPSSIRLVEIDATRETQAIEKPRIECSLVTVDLDSSPVFDALSYTWGYPLGEGALPIDHSSFQERKWPILCNGRILLVAANLWDFLHKAATEFPPDFNPKFAGIRAYPWQRSRYIWIDAICINQEDFDERSTQVTLMNRIYTQAKSVIAWLGADNGTTSAALEGLVRVALLDRAKANEAFISGRFNAAALGLDDIPGDTWAALYHYFDRVWFTRAWVMQEVVLARELVLLCGSLFTTWDVTSLAVSFLSNSGWANRFASQMVEFGGKPPFHGRVGPRAKSTKKWPRADVTAQGVKIMEQVMITRRAIRGKARSSDGLFSDLSLESLLAKYRPCQATDPRDKIYAALGVAKAGLPYAMIKAQLDKIVPDYRASVASVYTDAVRIMLASAGNLRILSHVQDKSHSKTPNLPSWVPDYSIPITADPFESMLVSFSASSHSKYTPIPSSSPTNLIIQAFKLDTITSVGTTDGPLLTRIAKPVSVLRPFYGQKAPRRVNFIRIPSTAPPGREDIFIPVHPPGSTAMATKIDALWRTITANTMEGIHPAPQHWQSAFSDWICLQVCQAMDKFTASGKSEVAEAELEAVCGALDLLKVDEKGGYAECAHLEVMGGVYDQMARRGGWGVEVPTTGAGTRIVPDSVRLRDVALRISGRKEGVVWDNGRVERFMNQADFVTDHRRAFSTADGYLGIGPASLEEGDGLFILAGADYPFVLREIDGGYEVIGEAYVHGIMHGEAVREEKFRFSPITLVRR
ncbi:hypothetical protein OQA88_10268 [Cercophora sp. LCS_1]